MSKTKKGFGKREGLLFGAMILVAIGIMVVFIVGMMMSSMWVALGGFFGGAAILVVIMMVFVFGSKKTKEEDVLKDEEKGMISTWSVATQDKQIDWYKTKKLIYQGKITGEAICPVCKLVIKKDEAMIMQCPQCLSLYHGEHFIEWLMENRSCPVCTFEIEVGK